MSAVMDKPPDIFQIEGSPSWLMWRRNLHARLQHMMELAFTEGKAGHRFRPLSAEEHSKLLRAMEEHPSLIFLNDEGRAVGALLCPCEICEKSYFAFVLQTGVALTAQVRGEMNYFMRDGDTAVGEECLLGVCEERMQISYSKLAADVAQQVSAEMGERLETRIKAEVAQQVSLQVAKFFAAEARSGTSQKKQQLVMESFRQQAEMLRANET